MPQTWRKPPGFQAAVFEKLICVFVRYGANKHSKGTARADLEWARPKTSGE